MAFSFAALSAQLRLDISNFSSNLSRASRQMRSFSDNMQNSYGAAASALNKHNLQLKDTVRIVHGIVIAQTFYQAVGAITDATRSLWDFNKALDYMHVTYSALFGNTNIASDFMAVLQEHSVETIFDYQGLADASKKLLAYGIDYQNLMFIMEGLTNLGAMSGDTAALDRIALALGQIYTKGKLSAEEMRQLANAYIPITEILQDKFGLTGDDLKRVGDLNLPAADVINAIVDYANENFASVGDAAMYTITGLQNRIVDTLKVVGTQMMTPVTVAYKSFLAYVSEGLEALRSQFETGGVGGIFEYLVPDRETQQIIRQFLANVKNLFMAVVSVGVVGGQIFASFASVFVAAFNVIAPVVTSFVNVLAAFLNALLETRIGALALRTALLVAASAFVILRAQALYALVVTAVTTAINGLSKALLVLSAIITRHPILAMIAALGVTLVGAALASDKANASISKLFGNLSGGVKGDDVLQKTEQELINSANAADQFNNRLEQAAGSAEDLENAINGAGGAADKAAKKTGGLLSFDEVFKLPEEKKDTGAGAGGDASAGLLGALGDLAGALGGLSGDLIPNIPDFSEFISSFSDSLFGGLKDNIADNLRDAGIGMLIGGGLGAIIGGLLGGAPGAIIGAKIGIFAGGLVGWFYDEIKEAFLTTDSSVVGDTIGAAVGGLIGRAFGKSITGATLGSSLGPVGTILGAAIGLLIDQLVDKFWTWFGEKLGKGPGSAQAASIGSSIGMAIGAIIGFVIGGPGGAAIGAGIGTLVGGLFGMFKDEIINFFTSPDGINSIIAAMAGMFTGFTVTGGNPIGIAIGGVVGSIVGAFWDTIDTKLGELAKLGAHIVEGVLAGIANTAVGKALISVGEFFSTLWKAFCDTFGINSPAVKMNPIGEYIIEGVLDGASNAFEGLITWVGTAGEDLIAAFEEWFGGISSSLATWSKDTSTKLSTWSTDNKTKISSWVSSTKASIITWADDTKNKFNTWVSDTVAKFISWSSNTKSSVTSWYNETKTKVTNWSTETKTSLSTWASSVGGSITTGMTSMITTMSTKLVDAKTAWDKKWSEIHEAFRTWWSGLGSSTGSWLETYIWKPISNFFNLSNFWNRVSSLLENIKSRIRTWWEGLTNIFDDTKANVTVNTNYGISSGASLAGHASGGVFNREHIARFAEGNRAEAIIPLENNTAMQPFVDAVANGLVGTLAPLVAGAGANNSNALPPMYVGTLIADDRGLKQLYRKFELISLQENERRGL